MFIQFLLLLLPLVQWCYATTHTFNFTTSYKNVTIPGTDRQKQVIAFNDEWPLPEIHINKGDRVQIYLTNGFEGIHKTLTSLHVHGIFHNTSYGNRLQMDGPSMITQCPIPPGQTYLYNFTVDEQVGSYWYHAHQGAQYGDGFRGAFIVHDPEVPFHFDEEMVFTLTDLYYEPYYDVEKQFMSRYNPMGNEPIPDQFLFNDRSWGNIHFNVDKTYLIRFINVGLFVSQYLTLEDHLFEIVEVDGVYVKSNITDVIYLAAGQRISVLVHSKKSKPDKNYALMQVVDDTMLDTIPAELKLQITNQVIYDDSFDAVVPIKNLTQETLDKHANNDFYLTTLHETPLYEKYDNQIVLDVRMETLGDGVKYAFFNNITYVPPRIPVLTTVLTSGKLVTNPSIYGDNINAFILEKDAIVEIVLNNYDTGRHPFHFHGHNFQIVQKSPGFHVGENFDPSLQDKMTVPYNESNPLMDYPDYPMIRDTVILEPNGHTVIRFKADNPGVWFFHCHVDWHLEQGLAAVFIEDPQTLQHRETLTDNYKEVCNSIGMANKGNAAGHSDDWLNMEGLPRQPKPLAPGFTIKGYTAFFVSTIVGLWGLYSITQYGLMEVIPDDEVTYTTLKKVLDDNSIQY
ncbi:similar to Saccharomyces cerevisiae YFL041W FET5 Multicopper oxidase, integral membrane protein with similarity to Fet3p [Maudiozyma barnettii]|uniref:Similar to Saccharomyces cerevisiae YFL041W FET5 Multicopper oxidase, integral membrane protein with similarity to Fet3p n=1 Tax=Maudiozyma barnettii TaxID=61262 RepID=A0A8H2ZG70_9SACH|nr:ferroxidase FET5 [Kazachstania barnettii]CAB4252485.1 similar to Saccharomyces cerevisiae YFL041W FET5 Multicopper oxidase, integral membrane protein with similarity to Fet3p [Kazachstania barnettii]CAD1779219.1 similar to Saccharomyces cerevisiae YFL041W FET5 Multicopper oxidase, integral membrane protein with similarity to Fet3p [Kazachstania barnettii]